ncbi:3D domain-containing protein [Sporomusa malonica]|uniref:3D (Asp-Asp-Asp) domain-containing protein n=1 Tax=Sporomusa malonica TaxID=112901 RepID=A0A1W2DAD8_9FIRM|nr:3D domain-containing protein [Sporomusa malonica]SMC94333.1 3D (Asp-Asp-Asp) domain-containing protein [Sporomusa malonica]
MKNKIAAILLMVFAMPLLSSALPKAEAAFLEDKLAEAVAGSPTAAQIQELIKIKDSLGQGNKEALWGTIAQTAIERTGKASTVNDIAAVAAQLTGQDQTGLKENIVKVVETTVRSKVQEKVQTEVTDRLAGYQNEFALLSMLLNNSNILTPKAVENNNSLAGAPQNYRKMLDMTATAYGPGPLDNGKWNDLTYAGGKVKKGVVAVDPNVIPMGTKLWIEGYGEAIADDQGSAIQGNRVDLAFNTRQEALDYGIKKVKVYVLN